MNLSKLNPIKWLMDWLNSSSIDIVRAKNLSPTPSPTMTPSPTPRITPPPDKAATPYYKDINSASSQYEIPEHILYRLLKRESMGFNPDVVSGKTSSPVGAQGIGQFMPDTAKERGIDPLNPKQAIPGSADYLRENYDEFGDWSQALAGYNAGPGAVRRYGGVPPYNETMEYIKAILQGLGYGY
jgi:soluble lytic murein transglycosylase-like protein